MEAATLRCPSCGAGVGEDDLQCPYCRSQLATVACPRCFGLVSLRSRHCPHCGSAIQIQAESPSNHACPECRIPLAASAVGALQVEQCDRCGGLWLPLEIFESLAADREARGQVLGALPGGPGRGEVLEANVRYRPCPECGNLMNRTNYGRISGVVLDACKGHGLWFDRDELRRVLAFIEGGGLERSRERQILELEEAKRQVQTAPPPSAGGWMEPETRPSGPGLLDLLGALEGLIERIRR